MSVAIWNPLEADIAGSLKKDQEAVKAFEYAHLPEAYLPPSGVDSLPSLSYREAAASIARPVLETQLQESKARVLELEHKIAEERQIFEVKLAGERESRCKRDEAEIKLAAKTMVQEALHRLNKLMEEIEVQRGEIYTRLEPEIVRLSLAVARRILGKEAAADPIPVAGAVCSTLQHLEAGVSYTLRVGPSREKEWKGWLSEIPAGSTVTIVPDRSIAEEDCRLETQLGKMDFSILAQLGEVERGFTDLVQQRPVTP